MAGKSALKMFGERGYDAYKKWAPKFNYTRDDRGFTPDRLFSLRNRGRQNIGQTVTVTSKIQPERKLPVEGQSLAKEMSVGDL
jgi:hypothetical protein